jgi:hypothetical protein
VVDERAPDIYRMLMREAKKFSFLPVAATPVDLDEDDQRKYTDKYLQTALTAGDRIWASQRRNAKCGRERAGRTRHQRAARP